MACAGRSRRHKGPVTRAYMDVLKALLCCFHNSSTGACFPSYERIADRADCARSTVAEAIEALELIGVLTWQNRITRVRERCRDLFGQAAWRWRVVRTSNAYVYWAKYTAPHCDRCSACSRRYQYRWSSSSLIRRLDRRNMRTNLR